MAPDSISFEETWREKMSNNNSQWTRRDVLQGTAAAAFGSIAGGAEPVLAAATSEESPRSPNRIQRENEKPGTRDWQLNRVRITHGAYRTALIEGYCSRQSVAAGESIDIFVSTSPARKFTIDLYRMGYYGGTGARHMQRLGPFQGTAQPVPEMTALPARLRECQWSPCTTLTIPADWPSGVYLGKLSTISESPSDPYWQSYVIFIVKDHRPADILFQCSDNTWQAYNRWPVNESLYTHPSGAHAPGVSVSFDRPYGMYVQIFQPALSIGSGEFLLWEYPLCYWLEQLGYDVTYGSNADCVDADFMTRARTFISVGHDEYWDLKQYQAAEAAIDSGVTFLWLCGNSVFIVSPFSDSSRGTPRRILTRTGCYGDMREEEHNAYAALFAGLQSGGPDERRIIGARSVVPFNGGGDWTCVNPGHWIFDGTGMQHGESIPGLVGWEHHGDPDLDRPGLEVLAEGSIWSGGTREGRYAATIFPGPRGNLVFNAATIFWAQNLAAPPGHILPWSHGSRPSGPDPRVQRITQNLLQRALRKTATG